MYGSCSSNTPMSWSCQPMAAPAVAICRPTAVRPEPTVREKVPRCLCRRGSIAVAWAKQERRRWWLNVSTRALFDTLSALPTAVNRTGKSVDWCSSELLAAFCSSSTFHRRSFSGCSCSVDYTKDVVNNSGSIGYNLKPCCC